MVRDWESHDLQYEWNEVADEEETPSYRTYEVGTPELGYLKLKRIAVTHYITTMAHSLVLGKFSLVWSLPIFARPQTRWSGPWPKIWDRD